MGYFAASPDGGLLLASGYGNNPNTKSQVGLADLGITDDLESGPVAIRQERIDEVLSLA
jgi:hypothetical protein